MLDKIELYFPEWYIELERIYLTKWYGDKGTQEIKTVLQKHKHKPEFLNCLIYFKNRFITSRVNLDNNSTLKKKPLVKKTYLFFDFCSVSFTPEFEKLTTLIDSLIEERSYQQAYTSYLLSMAWSLGKFIVDHRYQLFCLTIFSLMAAALAESPSSKKLTSDVPDPSSFLSIKNNWCETVASQQLPAGCEQYEI